MRSFEKTYPDLLLSLIPQHRLQVGTRQRIEQALVSGDEAAMQNAAIVALDELCRSRYFSRSEPIFENEHVVLRYVRSEGLYQIRLELPRAHWEGRGEPAPPAAFQRGVQVETNFDILSGIIQSFSINDQRESRLHRVTTVMESLPLWLGLAGGRLVLVEERLGDQEVNGSTVVTLADKVLHTKPIYERCRRSGRVEIVDLEAARAMGIAGPLIRAADARVERARMVALASIEVLGEFWGIIEVWGDPEIDAVTLRRRTEIARTMIGQVIENTVKLETLTSVDKLTRVYNRAFFDSQARIEIERATRSGSKLTMLFLDIDDFKTINDSLGHPKGDEALRIVADLIRKNLRKIDMPFRYGGEEFVILLPGTSEVEAIHTAERLRSVIAESNEFRDSEGNPRPVRVSIGAAVFPDTARDEKELVSRADMALLRAKRRGKNRVEFHRD